MSHSVLNDMETIQQTPPSKTVGQQTIAAKLAAIDNDNFFSDYSTNMYDCGINSSGNNFNMSSDRDKVDIEFVDAEEFDKIEPIGSVHTNITSMFLSGENSGIDNNSKCESTLKVSSSSKSVVSNKHDYSQKNENTAQKRFGNAKGFGSAQFFADNKSDESDTVKLARFQGSNAISSDDFFTNETHSSNHNVKSMIYIVYVYYSFIINR